MRILIEGQSYFFEDLKKIFNDATFYTVKGDSAIINSVGYYYSVAKKEVVYMLPKVFMAVKEQEEIIDDEIIKCHWDKKNTIFKTSDSKQNLTLKNLFEFENLEGSLKHESKYEWIRYITINFYNSLIEFRRRNQNTTILNTGNINNLNTNIGEDEYTYLDLYLSFINFYKKNKSVILFRHIEHISDQIKKPKWEKTIRKSLPIIDKNNAPIYLNIRNKKSVIDTEEQLIIYFLSILNRFKVENHLNILIDKSYKLIKGEAFDNLLKNGLGMSKLRKIKYKYFSDLMRRMYRLCEIYFDSTDSGNIKKHDEEFISFNKYNIVFEDMVDKLLTDETSLETFNNKTKQNDISIKKLKNNDDGKIIDHLFEYEGLIDTSNIFYIGDSKYYKPGNLADKLSIYKQFTYAKNIIQYNIDLFNNEPKTYASNKLKYRDALTEGYNITPNFLLYGIIDKYDDFTNDNINLLIENDLKGSIKHSYHWETRLFDRDSLFICQYTINYLFVLNAYTEKSESSLIEYRQIIKNKFRENFINYFKESEDSKFTFYKLIDSDLKKFIDKHFKILNGKCFSLDEKTLLIAFHEKDKNNIAPDSLETLLKSKINLSPNSPEIYKFSEDEKSENNSTKIEEEKLSIAAEDIVKYGEE
jgi:hypothetical protein